MRQFIICMLFFSLVVGCKQEKEQSPNIVFILADDLGYSDLSVYRNQVEEQWKNPSTAQTPNIDLLAAEGMKFTDFYCGAAVCSPSRSALITGRNATRVGIYNWVPPDQPMHLRDDEMTIAEMVKSKGYQTGHFGKWHLTSEGMGQPIPNDQGFDYSFFTYNNAIPSHHNPVNFHRNGEPVGDLEGYSCQLVVDEAIQWISRRDANAPFYINVWFNEPHEKVAAPDSLKERHEYHQAYYGAIENMDHAVGRLTAYLKANGLEENTIIMFSSDNGSQVKGSDDPLRGRKAFNYEGGIRVPFIIKWDGKIGEGTQSNVPASFTDILPTLGGIVKAELPKKKLDGQDISGLFGGEVGSFVRETPLFFYRYFHDPVCMLREGDWVLLGYEKLLPYQDIYNTVELANLKPEEGEGQWSMWRFNEIHMEYIRNQQVNAFELYNVRNDPGQKEELSGQYPDRVKEMKSKTLDLKEEMIAEGGDWYER